MVIGITALIAIDYGSDRRSRVQKQDKNIRGKA
jgi:hypothetical protein